jgi:hypothetical protein
MAHPKKRKRIGAGVTTHKRADLAKKRQARPRKAQVRRRFPTLRQGIEFLFIEVLDPFVESSLYEDYKEEATTCRPEEFDACFDEAVSMLRGLKDVEVDLGWPPPREAGGT